jgi:hypothetical protein
VHFYVVKFFGCADEEFLLFASSDGLLVTLHVRFFPFVMQECVTNVKGT